MVLINLPLSTKALILVLQMQMAGCWICWKSFQPWGRLPCSGSKQKAKSLLRASYQFQAPFLGVSISIHEHLLNSCHYVIQVRPINWYLVMLPNCDPRYKDINNSYLNGWAFKSNDCHGRSSNMPSSNTTTLHYLLYLTVIRGLIDNSNRKPWAIQQAKHTIFIDYGMWTSPGVV